MVKKISIVTLIIAILSTIAVYAAEPYDYSGDYSTSNDASDEGYGSGAQGAGQNDYVIAEVNDDEHKQTLYVQYGDNNSIMPTKIWSKTEGTGDYLHTGDIYYRTQSITLTIKSPVEAARSITVPVTQRSEQNAYGKIDTYYEYDLSAVQNIGPNELKALKTAVTGVSDGTSWSQAATYIEASGNLAVTADNGVTWTSYTIKNDNNTIQQVSALTVLNTWTGRYNDHGANVTLKGAFAELQDTNRQIQELYRQGINKDNDPDKVWEKLDEQKKLLNADIDAAVRNLGLNRNAIHALLANANNPDSAFNGMMNKLKNAAEQAGLDLDKFDGVLNDADTLSGFAELFLNKMGFRSPKDILNHLDWMFKGKRFTNIPGADGPEKLQKELFKELMKDAGYNDKEIEEEWEKYKDGQDEESGGERPDFRQDPYNPTGSIKHTEKDLEPHKIKTLFDLGEPIVYTYNDSVAYNDEDGKHHVGFADELDSDGNGPGIIIPSSERYLNGITVNTTNGRASIGLAGQESTYTCTYSYQYQQMINAWKRIEL